MTTTIDILDRICPDEADLPPSARTWARIVPILGGVDALELRDPNDGLADPAQCARYQYMISPLARDVTSAHLWRRRLPPAPIDAPPVDQVVRCGSRDAWADSLGAPWPDADPAAAWELVAPGSGLAWEWAAAQGVRPYPTSPQRTTDEWDIHGTGDTETEGYIMPPRDPWDIWAAVTGAPCPLCDQELVWSEAGHVPGYRVCMARRGDRYDGQTIRHRWLWRRGVLVRDSAAEANA